MLRITALHSVHDMTLRTTGVNIELVLSPLAFTSMFSASQLDKTISGSQGQRDLPF